MYYRCRAYSHEARSSEVAQTDSVKGWHRDGGGSNVVVFDDFFQVGEKASETWRDESDDGMIKSSFMALPNPYSHILSSHIM